MKRKKRKVKITQYGASSARDRIVKRSDNFQKQWSLGCNKHSGLHWSAGLHHECVRHESSFAKQ